MDKQKISLLILIFVMITAGCGISISDKLSYENKDDIRQEKKDDSLKETIESSIEKINEKLTEKKETTEKVLKEDKEIKDNKEVKETKSSSQDLKKESTKLKLESGKGEVLDYDALNKLDNTKKSWWIKLNNQNKPTTISDGVKQLIEKHNAVYIGATSKKVVYITFDEGYENGYTSKILDVLRENDVKSIFFVTGPYIKNNPKLVQRMLDEGHEVGNHSVNHPSLPNVGNTALEKELWGLEKDFKVKFGKGFKYLRPPIGEYSERTLEAANQLGYKTVFWSYAYADYDVKNQKGADNAYNVVMNNMHDGAVILLHAVSKDNTEALDRIIKAIKAQGYIISPFDL